MLKPKRVRKGGNGRKALRSQKSQDGANAAAVCQGMEEERVPRVALPERKVTKKRKNESDGDEEEDESDDQEEEEELEVQPGEKGGDLDEEEYDLSKYQYLIQKPHYDPDDEAVFKFMAINVDDEGNIVVYRSKYNSDSSEWSEVNMDDPIHVAAVVRQMKAILQSKPMATQKQKKTKKKLARDNNVNNNKLIKFFSPLSPTSYYNLPPHIYYGIP